MKKKLAALLALCLSATLFSGCVIINNDKNDDNSGDDSHITAPDDNKDDGNKGDNDDKEDGGGTTTKPETDWFEAVPANAKQNLSAGGYATDKISDFSQYVGTSAYRTVSTVDELINAVVDAKCDYTTTWDDATNTYSQTLNAEGKVHVIEITQDLNLGYYKLSAAAKSSGVVEDFSSKNANQIKDFTMSDMFTENGITKLKIERTCDLLIYSKNGAKLTHCGISLLSDNNVVVRNIQMDEIWQWEDAPAATKNTGAVGDYDAFGWAYFKVSHCGYVWIDHCTFGKSYDGQIDYSNPVSYTKETAPLRAPYGYDNKNGLQISWCKFNAGSDDPDGYLYKMMDKIEKEYQSGGVNYLYYNALRDGGISFEDILYGLAMPQKKGFLCGDNGNDNTPLQISFANCIFKNLEDRIPKLRGGNAVMYNCLIDSSQYYEYRNKLRSANAAGLVASVNSSWKCALVSQCILAGQEGSVYAENCIYRGISDFIKNNDSGNGGYRLVNCSYKSAPNGTPIVGSTVGDKTVSFPVSGSNPISAQNFSWHTQNGEQPFNVTALGLDKLEETLNNADYGAGINSKLQERLLKSKY